MYRITPEGQSAVIFEPQELQVQALVVDKNGVIYAATNPDGKVYKIEHRGAPKDSAKKGEAETKSAVDSSWTSSAYFVPGTKYIWDLALDGAGNLYVATGDHGEIFRVTRQGDHSVFFKSDEAHIRVLIFDPEGNLIAGSDGSGLVYRISPHGEGLVLYSAPKKEITALAIDAAGNIYAAGAGEKHGAAVPTGFTSAPISMVPSSSGGGAQAGIVISAAPSGTAPPAVNFSGAGATTAGF